MQACNCNQRNRKTHPAATGGERARGECRHGRVAAEQMRLSGSIDPRRPPCHLPRYSAGSMDDGPMPIERCGAVLDAPTVRPTVPVRPSLSLATSSSEQSSDALMPYYVRTTTGRGPAGRPEWSKAKIKSSPSSSAGLPASPVVTLVALLVPYCTYVLTARRPVLSAPFGSRARRTAKFFFGKTTYRQANL